MNYRKILLGTMAALTLSGCGILGKVTQSDVVASIQLGVDVVYLDAEYENVRDTLLLIDWEEGVRSEILTSIAVFQKVKDELDVIMDGDGDATQAAVGIADGRRIINALSDAHNTIRSSYIAHLRGTVGAVPDPELARYDAAGGRVFARIVFEYQTTGFMDVKALHDLLRYAAEGYLAYQTGGVGGLLLDKLVPKPVPKPVPAPKKPGMTFKDTPRSAV